MRRYRVLQLVLVVVFIVASITFINSPSNLKNSPILIAEYKPVDFWILPKSLPSAESFVSRDENIVILFNAKRLQNRCDLYVFVFSSPENYDLREAIRKSWGSHKKVNNKTIGMFFFIGITNQREIQNIIYEEYINYDDVIQVKYNESTSDTSVKALMMLKIVEAHIKETIGVLLKTIDTIYLNLEHVVNEILSNFTDNVLMGNLQVETPINCNSSMCRGKFYPNYLFNSFWLMSVKTALKLLNTSRNSAYFEQEDVYVTGFLAEEANIKRADHNMFVYVEKKFDPCILSRIVISHNLTPKDILTLHRKMLDVARYDCEKTICSLPTTNCTYIKDEGAVCLNPNELQTLIYVENFCKNPSNLLVLVASNPGNFERRTAVRETWGNAENSRMTTVQTYFFLGAFPKENNSLQINVTEESKQYKDIIQLDFQDTYYNLTLKTILMLMITSLNCTNAKFVMKADDDAYVNIPYLDALLITRIPKNFLMGSKFVGSQRVDNVTNKWYISKSVYKKFVYPDYLSGAGYLMSTDVARKIYQLSYKELTYFLEDVYITGILPKILSIKLKTFPGYTMPHPLDHSTSSRPYSCIYVLKILLHADNVEEMYMVHRVIQSRDMFECVRKRKRKRRHRKKT